MLSGTGPSDELITRPEESYRLWCVVVCDLETSRMRRPCPALGRSATKKMMGVRTSEVEETPVSDSVNKRKYCAVSNKNNRSGVQNQEGAEKSDFATVC